MKSLVIILAATIFPVSIFAKECSHQNLVTLLKSSRELHAAHLDQRIKARSLFQQAEKDGKTLSQAVSEYYLMLKNEDINADKHLNKMLEIAKKFPECNYDGKLEQK